MSKVEEAAKNWRQTELEKRGEKHWYRPRTVNEAFVDGVYWERARILEALLNAEMPIRPDLPGDPFDAAYEMRHDCIMELKRIVRGEE